MKRRIFIRGLIATSTIGILSPVKLVEQSIDLTKFTWKQKAGVIHIRGMDVHKFEQIASLLKKKTIELEKIMKKEIK